ncbi:hypothetical protein FK178_03800 [Antarcticibacterium arcticum]|uniref:STAS/SEC14 domain-containing protein n=1 Tax=Antarcticibacterium arcticum TaxID=2585771 RepID=A0A5B8YJ70_9FLAO|nr:hypothetical protein [Antarcticibacterium arcticum]QED36887.1 hypothetical protein FK178_03800 [Antarcticibacterium arcticum]
MTNRSTSHYNLIFFDSFVIAEAHENSVVTPEVVNENLKLVFDHFNGKEFTLISHRKYNYSLDLNVYTLKLIKKLRGIAIVSTDSGMKEKAALEQLAFHGSFAFFENLEDAKRWAGSMVTSKA